jgi:hypothetical protein
LKAYNITNEKSYFLSPVDGKTKIYWFPDPPHLLKCLRNHFLDDGFALQDGNIVDATELRTLIKANTEEVSSVFKLRSILIDCTGTERQNVSFATNLLSHTSATAIRRYFSKEYLDKADVTANFIEQVDSWFDVMNSKSWRNFQAKKKKDLVWTLKYS